jgi:hypothetical protein
VKTVRKACYIQLYLFIKRSTFIKEKLVSQIVNYLPTPLQCIVSPSNNPRVLLLQPASKEEVEGSLLVEALDLSACSLHHELGVS